MCILAFLHLISLYVKIVLTLSTMIRHRPLKEVLEDLRFSLDVMEENSHFGLDDQFAEVLRNKILSKIARIEAQIARESGALTSR